MTMQLDPERRITYGNLAVSEATEDDFEDLNVIPDFPFIDNEALWHEIMRSRRLVALVALGTDAKPTDLHPVGSLFQIPLSLGEHPNPEWACLSLGGGVPYLQVVPWAENRDEIINVLLDQARRIRNSATP